MEATEVEATEVEPRATPREREEAMEALEMARATGSKLRQCSRKPEP